MHAILLTPDYFMTSARLGFRRWRDDDLPLALGLWGDSEVTERIGGPFTPEQVRDRLASEIAHMRDPGMQYWPIFLLADGQHVGCAGLRPYRQDERIHELGVHLRRAFWRHGLAEEAARRVIDYAFGVLRAEALFAGHHPQNEASRRLLTKLGFVYTHDELYAPTGLLHPSYLFRNDPTDMSWAY